MAFPTSVNDQITDSITQVNTKVLGDAPATAMGNFMVATSQALSNAAHNATSAQQQATITAQAATTQGISTLYSIDTASTGLATQQIYSETVEGHIFSKISSPMGKKDVERTVEQANHKVDVQADQATLDTLHNEMTKAIQTALAANVSKQSVCYCLHQAMEERNISMLYPFDMQGKKISDHDVTSYYHAIIQAHRAENKG